MHKTDVKISYKLEVKA